MNVKSLASRAAVAVLTAYTVLVSPIPAHLDAQTSTAKPAPTPQEPVPEAAPLPEDPDGGWPRDYTTPSGGAIRVFQPQVSTWTDQQHLVAYSAVSYNAKDAKQPAMGTVKLEADTTVALSERLVNFTNLKLTESNFPNLPKEQHQEVVARIQRAVPDQEMIIALDRVLARLDKSQIIPRNVDSMKANPPEVFYSTSTAVLVNIDGEPVWSPIQGNDLKFAVNTNWDLFSIRRAMRSSCVTTPAG